MSEPTKTAQRIVIPISEIPRANAELLRIGATAYVENQSTEAIGSIIFRRTPIAAGILRMRREGKV